MRSRFFNELTTGEVADYLARGGSLAILPVGSLEMHGPHLPLGTDSLIARAAALKLAEKADGLVLPELNYTWAGATDGFPGTVSVEPELAQRTAEAVADKLVRMGFKKLVLLNAHYPNNHVFYLTARRFYETHRPILLTDISQPYSEKARINPPNESSLLLAALIILGMSHLYPEKEAVYDDPAPLLHESYRRLGRAGTVGYNYQDARQHVSPSLDTSAKAGLEFIELQVETLAPLMEDLDKYIDFTEEQWNRGWWRER